jgi:hypothetical protein
LEARKPKGINRIAKICQVHLCMREEILSFNNDYRGVGRIMEKYRHRLFRRRIWDRLWHPGVQSRALVRGPGGEVIQQKGLRF